MKSLFLLIYMLLFFLGGIVPSAWAVISGSMEWNYVDFERDNKDGDDYSASSFSQQYSVMYNKSGLLSAGRLGSWNLGIGAEWTAFDTKLDGSDLDDESFKLLYNGDLLLAPGGLPFRLYAYSYDLRNSITFEDAGLKLRQSHYFRPGIVTSLLSGQTISSGFQFLGGVRNGSYLGKYREVLSKFPKLLIDYRSIYHRDVNAVSKTKYRERDLAFVSLNKKDNWFHYRIYDYKDYIGSRQDTREETILLGTIDHNLKRQWIHLTNWIQISVDGSYTSLKEEFSVFNEENRYDVNLFSTMQWHNLDIANFTHYSRERKGNQVTQYLDIPVYLNNRISPDVNLRGQLIVNSWKDKIDNRVRDKEDIYYSTAKYETNITRRIKIDYGVEAEYNTRERGDGQGLRAEVEAYSNMITRSRVSWYGNLGLGCFYGDGAAGDDTDYWEGFGAGRVTYNLTRSLSLEASQELVYGAGSIGAYTTSYLAPRSTRGFNYNDGEEGRNDDYFRSQTGLALEHIGWNRLSNRLNGFYKFEEDSLESNWSFELEHRLRFNKKSFSVYMTNFFSTGDSNHDTNTTTINLDSYQGFRSIDDLLRHETRLSYLPNKYWEAGLDLEVEWRRGKTSGGKNNDSTLILLTQRLQRNFYVTNGVIRKLADIEQRFRYDKFSDDLNRDLTTFTLAGHYYPTKLLYFGGRFEYRDYNPGEGTMQFSLTAGLHFPKFQVDFDYDYGTDVDRKIVAQRYELNVRKTF